MDAEIEDLRATPNGEQPDGTLPPDDDDVAAISDEDFLRYVRDERQRSVGFDSDSELIADRTRNLNYYKGDMEDDMPAPDGRSGAVSMDIQDTVQTVLPDLIDIFIEEDVAAFQPLDKGDEAQAQTETDYVEHVVFDENDGFTLLYTAFHDALVTKTGLLTWDWEPIPVDDQVIEDVGALDVATLLQAAIAQGVELEVEQLPADDGYDGEARFRVTIPAVPDGRLVARAIPPEDFTIAEDAGPSLRDTTYCAWRSRPRIQDLICAGYDADLVRSLPAYSIHRNDAEFTARDTVDEHSRGASVGGLDDLRKVEVTHHYLRVDADDDGEPELWQIVTGDTERVLLRKKRVHSINIAALTPFITPHRFYGVALADLLVEIQRIKTALTRGQLDSLYFAQNQRYEVSTSPSAANEFTLPDLLNNVPGWPVRSKSGNAVRAIGGAERINGLEALEYFDTVKEQRTGIVRMAQGLNPDTLHDTASGALALLTQAQRRIRLIARIFAETGLKDFYLGIHATLRQNAQRPVTRKLRNRWTDNIIPSTWPERQQMKVKIGLGASGRQHDLAFMQQIMGLQEKVVQMQQGVNGPFVTARNISNALEKFATLGQQDANAYFSDPEQAPPQPPKPDPRLAIEQQKATLAQGQLQLESRKLDILQAKTASDATIDGMRLQLDQLKQRFEQVLAAAKLNQDRELALAETEAHYQTTTDTARIRAEAEALSVGADVAISAASHAHDHALLAHEAAEDRLTLSHQAAHDDASQSLGSILGAVAEPEAGADDDQDAEGEPS